MLYKSIYRILVFILIQLIGFSAYSQFDSNYVFLTKDKFTVYPLFESSISDFYYDYNHKNGDITSLSYDTRQYNSLGFGASFYRFGFSLTLELPRSSIPQLQNLKAFAFKGGYSYRRFFGELRIKTFSGVEEKIVYPDYNIQVYKIRKDIKINQYGGHIYYFFSKKYNFDASFKNYNIQRKSAISPFINAGINYYNINGDFLLSDSLSFNVEDIITDINNTSFRIIPSFAATGVYKCFYIAAMVGAGIGFNRNNVELNNHHSIVYGIMPLFEFNSSVGYNSENFFASFVFTIETDRLEYNNSYLGTIHTMWNIKIGKKINIKHLGKIGPYL